MIRLAIPSIEENDLQAVRDVLLSGYLVQGSHVAQFEKSIAQLVGSEHAIAVSNATAALHLSLLALGIVPGDRVIVTTYSWIATANVIALCGAEPIFVDINPATFNMDADQLEVALERSMNDLGKRPKAIIPVHTFGQLADMPRIIALAQRYDIPVIEDAACALGATLNNRQAGGWAKTGCFSFHPRKAITTGEGGVITTNDAALARNLRALRNHGADPDASSPDFIMPGFNYRMTEFQAALGLTQMNKLERIILARRRLAERYDQLLADTRLQAPVVMPDSCSVYQSYIVLLPSEVAAVRPELIAAMTQQGIQTNIGTYHMPMTTYFRERYHYKLGDFPVSEDVFARSLALPLHEYLTDAEQIEVVQAVSDWVDAYA
ncbi:MAG: DegT/DnrJ/EryC1/StrS family aminotransferase [Anaerolineae bacterium]|nr:DegT/DnrJ/EryC1/StrS family aminotransferase [Anaerolineae bacterium]